MATIVIDIELTRALWVANYPGTDDDFSVLVDLPADGPVVFEGSGNTHLYPVDYDGVHAEGLDFIPPETPEGGTLVSLVPWVVAHTEDGPSISIEEDTSGWGYSPPPTLSPFLYVHSDLGPIFDTFPADTDPDEKIVCSGGALGEEGFQQVAMSFTEWGTGTTTKIVMSRFGWRYTFETPDPPPPASGEGDLAVRRHFPRSRRD